MDNSPSTSAIYSEDLKSMSYSRLWLNICTGDTRLAESKSASAQARFQLVHFCAIVRVSLPFIQSRVWKGNKRNFTDTCYSFIKLCRGIEGSPLSRDYVMKRHKVTQMVDGLCQTNRTPIAIINLTRQFKYHGARFHYRFNSSVISHDLP